MTDTPAAQRDLVEALRRQGVADVDDSALSRAMYASDASLYRVPPRVVVRPRSVEEIPAVLAVARESGTPLTMRGAGTSIAGNAVGPGIVVDTARHLHRIHGVDAESRTAVVEPGVVHASLQREAARHGLRFGPDPSTHTRCTVGGMIGNNACGSRALGYGRTVDNVAGLDVVTAAGELLRLGPDAPASRLGDALAAVVDGDLGTVRTSFGRFTRQVSGYSLEHLLPENGRRVDRFLVGSEGTLAVVAGATVHLVEEPAHRGLAVLGFPSMPEAADAVPALLDQPLVACEGLDSRLVDVLRSRPGRAVPELPHGSGWLFAEVTGSTEAEVVAAARRVVTAAGSPPHRVVTDQAEQAALWRIREDGAGLAARSLDSPAHAGWEDAAVPPAQLGAYLRSFDDLLVAHGLHGVPYGHFGDGCVHIRIDFGLDDAAGRRGYRAFVEEGADLVASYGGSFSGEHGDGRARSELLPRMYSPESLALFAGVKAVLDPDNLLNPGVLVDPAPFDADLRTALTRRTRDRVELRMVEDGGSFTAAVHRCTGVGKCLAAPSPTGVMCPSYLATRDEKDSTRGRARMLQELMAGDLVDGWRSDAVHDALDLCLACKGCASDCPTGTDMATYKAEALHQRYRRRLRPRSHYTLGSLPRLAALGTPVAGLLNRVMGTRAGRRLAAAGAGIDHRRSLPALARRSMRGSAGVLEAEPDVWLWADTFTDRFSPEVGAAAVRVLARAGLRAAVIPEPACCGLTWFSTGRLTRARQVAAQAVEVLHGYVATGVPVVGLEPSCLAALRSDVPQLLDDPRATEVARSVKTLAELLVGLEGWEAPDLRGTDVLVQPHCHHASVLGWGPDADVLARTGATVTRVGGCCGLAGNFGVEKGHYEVSVAVAEQQLLPALRASAAGTLVLADGFSCRTQLADLATTESFALAQLLDRAETGGPR